MDVSEYIRFIFVLSLIITLIYFLAHMAKRFNLLPHTLKVNSSNIKRLQILESISFDAKRRLILIARDGVEHLILLGTESESVVEVNIVPPRRDNNTPPLQDVNKEVKVEEDGESLIDSKNNNADPQTPLPALKQETELTTPSNVSQNASD